MPMSRVLSVNLATAPARLPGRQRVTGIGKRPVNHAVRVEAPGTKGVGGSGLLGDVIGDLRHHGGDDQAVYAYAREDLDWWQVELGKPLANGLFGENLTTVGINISQALVGEQWLIGGEVLLQVSDPRIPCATFQAVVGEKRWVKRFTQRAAPGTYLRVLRGGMVHADDSIVVVERPRHHVSVSMAFRALTTEPELCEYLVDLQALSPEARDDARRTVGAGSLKAPFAPAGPREES
jgi:MOSC domain-containing protein YiiM